MTGQHNNIGSSEISRTELLELELKAKNQVIAELEENISVRDRDRFHKLGVIERAIKQYEIILSGEQVNLYTKQRIAFAYLNTDEARFKSFVELKGKQIDPENLFLWLG